MSLRPDDRSGRSRDKSGTRDRSRSRSNVRAPKAPSPPPSTSYGGYSAQTMPPLEPNMPGSFGDVIPPTYDARSTRGVEDRTQYFSPTISSAPTHYPPPPAVPYPHDAGGFTMGDYKDLPPHERPGYIPPRAAVSQYPRQDDLAYGDRPHTTSRHPSFGTSHPSQPGAPESTSTPYTYQYAQPPDKITYTTRPQGDPQRVPYTQSTQTPFNEPLSRTYSHNTNNPDARIVDMTPGHDRRDRTDSTDHRLSVGAQQAGLQAPRSAGLGPRMDRLSVSGNRPDMSGFGGAGVLPPPSPLLEAYRGTYQSISPMPMAIRPMEDDELSDLEPLSPVTSRRDVKDKLGRDAEDKKKRVKVYDAEEDAKLIAKALNHSKVDAGALIDILPGLTHDQIWELRKEYKKQVKIQGKGINLSKHLKMKVTGMFGKAVYVVALGRWESEGYWANFWYQAHGSRRELLIESLMGRTNAEIRNIKDEFRDKRYADSLVKCMEKELKMDKFRTAVLMVLEERRQEEQDVYPLEYRNRDVEMLNRALTAKQGGESAMLEIIVRRSNAHLREVLRTYERMYQENFARAALKKSNNLVGEVIAHILNGVINKPARDALLLHHAIKDIHDRNKDDDLRYELLVSRLVRLHWDRLHLMRVRKEYVERYGKELQEEIEEATREGDFRDFMCELCETR